MRFIDFLVASRVRGSISYSCFLCCCLSVLASAQELSLEWSATEALVVGETATAHLHLRESPNQPFLGSLPRVPGLSLRADGPQRVADAWQWTLTLTPWRAGEFQLPALTVDDGQSTHKTEPVLISAQQVALYPERLSIDFGVSPERVVPGQDLEIELVLAFDAAFFRTNALQVFGRRLDLPVVLKAPGLELAALEVVTAEATAALATVVLNGELVEGRWVDGTATDPRSRLVLRRRLRVDRVGRLDLGTVIGTFEFATEFAEDFFGNLEAQDRRRGRVYSSNLAVTVAAAPERGRPADFSGLIGRVELQLSCADPKVQLAKPFLLDLELRSDVSLEGRDLPRFEFAGLHVFAQREVATADHRQRRLQLEVAVLAPDLQEIPALRLTYFRPADESYAVAESQPIPIQLTLSAAQAADWAERKEAEKAEAGVLDDYGIYAQPTPGLNAAQPQPWSVWTILGLMAGPWALAWFWHRRLKQLDWARQNPSLLRAQRAFRTFRSAMRRGAEPLKALTDYLAARSLKPSQALHRGDLAQELAVLELPADLLARATEVFGQLLAHHFGDELRPPNDAEILALVEAIEGHQKEEAA